MIGAENVRQTGDNAPLWPPTPHVSAGAAGPSTAQQGPASCGLRSAPTVGFNILPSLHSVRIEGPNEAGMAARITRILSQAGINLRGLSAAVIGERFTIYLAVDSHDDATEIVTVLSQL